MPRPLHRALRPAGQADMSFTPAEVGITDTSSGTGDGLVFSDPSQWSSGPATGFTITPGASGQPDVIQNGTPLTSAQQTALFNGIGTTLNTAGQTIAAIVQSGDATARAGLGDQVSVAIARMQQQLVSAQAAGNVAAAQIAQAQLQQLYALHNVLVVSPADATNFTYMVVGAAGAATLALLWTATRAPSPAPRRASARARKNPSCGCGGRTRKNPSCGCSHR